MKKYLFILPFIFLFSCAQDYKKAEITKPKLTNNPSLDVICTNRRPLLSFFNSKGGIGKRTYFIELDTSKEFNSPNLVKYKNVKEENKYLASKRVHRPLLDKSRYYWRVKAKDSHGNESDWAMTRFYVDSSYNKKYLNLQRIKVKSVEVSTGQNPKSIIDLDDPGQVRLWQAAPPGPIRD